MNKISGFYFIFDYSSPVTYVAHIVYMVYNILYYGVYILQPFMLWMAIYLSSFCT